MGQNTKNRTSNVGREWSDRFTADVAHDTRAERKIFTRSLLLALVVGVLAIVAGFNPISAQQPQQAQQAQQAQQPGKVAQAAAIRDLDVSHTLPSGPDHRNGQPLMVGAFLGDNITTPTRVDSAMAAYNKNYGTSPKIMRFYSDLNTPLGTTSDIGSSLVESAKKGAIAMLVVEPTWKGAPQKDLLTAIANGAADSLVAARTRELSKLGLSTMYIELASEMNGRFGALWQAAANGMEAAPAEYQVAYRRMVDVARKNGGKNIKWVWAPVAGNGYTHDASGDKHFNYSDHWYPGDAYVDVIGLHNFNDPVAQGAWVPFSEIIDGAAADNSLTRLTTAHPSKPVMITEFGTDEHPNRASGKAEWIADMYKVVNATKSIVGIVWFDINKERDWRIGSSAQSAAAFGAGARAAH